MASATELLERRRVQLKGELVQGLLGGDALDAVSCQSQVPAHELKSWNRVFREPGASGKVLSSQDR